MLLAGCGGDARVETHPVSGTVSYQGRPAEGAEVALYWAGEEQPIDEKFPIPAGAVGADGGFKLKSFSSGDGAPAGAYNVTVVWPEPLKPGASPESAERRDRLRGKYADPATSGLTATVEAAPTTLPPIELK